MQTNWDKEADVVIAGYGLAGAVAAIEATDAGAKVLILEKGEYPGGLSILSGGGVICARDVDAAATYLTETSGGRVDASLITTFAQGLVETEQHMKSLAAASNAGVQNTTAIAQEEGAFSLRGYPFPGRETFYMCWMGEVPGFKGFPWVQRLKPLATNLMKVVFDNVEKRKIEVMLSTPARRLVTDAEGAVTGVVAQKEGSEITVRARRAVVLACGGFEQNQWLLKQYLQGTPFFSMAPLTHTGDGIIMAQKVGAALWHMWHVHGSYGFKFPEFPIAFRTPMGGQRNPRRMVPWIVVDKSGNRYLNEYQPAPQDSMHRAMEIYDPDMPGYPRIPSYIIFDEAGRKRGPIAQPLAIGEYIYEWSKDNMKELAKGWLLTAPTIRELALKIKETGDNEGKMTPETLEATVSQWNNCVATGKDPLSRPAGTMIPIQAPPFYAVPVWPIISNTQGGPVHNARQQIVDAFDQPIPHLYAAGELGSFWSHLYLLAGNLSECLISGRIAGRNAAGEK